MLESTPVVPTHNPKRDAGLIPHKVNDTWVLGTGNNKRVIRTVEDGDKLLSSMPARRRAATRQGAALRSNDGPERASTGTGPTRSARVPNELVDAYIRGMHKLASQRKGKKVPPLVITKEMRKLARLELQRKADIAAYCKN